MSSEYKRVTSFKEFQYHVLPRIVDEGYNTVQLMGIQEHPYYGSFGYHVSNLYAFSSRVVSIGSRGGGGRALAGGGGWSPAQVRTANDGALWAETGRGERRQNKHNI